MSIISLERGVALVGASCVAVALVGVMSTATDAPRMPTPAAFVHLPTMALAHATKSAAAAPMRQWGVAEEIVIEGTKDRTVADGLLTEVPPTLVITTADAVGDIAR